MRERHQIVDLWRSGDAAVLVTLTGVEGSSYRRPGARLLIGRNGGYAGSISGGCLDAEVIRKAQWMVRNGATMQRYSTLFDDTGDIPYGLGCGGAVDLLLEPAGTPEFEALMRAMEGSLRGEAHSVETRLPSPGVALQRSLEALGSRPHPAPGSEIFLGPGNVFREVLSSPQRLLICGAGDDAQPMVRMAALLGWRVFVLDGRSQWARVERFPDAEQVLTTAGVDVVDVQRDDAVVIMTHSYEQDRAWLAATLPRAPRYLGLLGARHRSALLLSEAATMLGWDLARACESVFAPIGLNLGGDGAEAIALATIAEIHACCEGKLDSPRRMNAGEIAEHLSAGGASRYLQTQCAL